MLVVAKAKGMFEEEARERQQGGSPLPATINFEHFDVED